MSKVAERVTFYEERGDPRSVRYFRRVDIQYANGDLFYSGWIQDFGDVRTGPTVFASNYEEFGLDDEMVHKRETYWEAMDFASSKIVLRDSDPADLDNIIDLNFQNFFEGGNNRISAYQGLNHALDYEHTTICVEISGVIYGFIFIDWRGRGESQTAYFDSLYTAPAVRGRGLGHHLIEAGIERARQKKFRNITGEVSGGFDHCRTILRLLGKHGFNVVHQVELFPGWYTIDVRLDLLDEGELPVAENETEKDSTI